MRGHRLSLVWLGYRLGDLRRIRSNSIGAERSPDIEVVASEVVKKSLGDLTLIDGRNLRTIERYIGDLIKMVGQCARVLKTGGQATFVIGDSLLNDVKVRNASALKAAAKLWGLDIVEHNEREMPSQSRYLPMNTDSALNKRMKT